MRSATTLRRTARRALDVTRDLLFALRHCRNRLEVARAVLSGAGETTVMLRDGTVVTGPEARTLVPLMAEVFVDRAYDRGRVGVRRGDVVLDIGAHVGSFAVHAARSGASRVIAVEPSPLNVPLLRRNVERNLGAGGKGACDVLVVEAAVGDRDGRARLGLGRFSVGNVLLDAVDQPAGRVVDVEAITLAGIFARHGLEHVDYLKIDCEGSEGALLGATPRELLGRVDRVALEYHDGWSTLDHRELARLLGDAGFSVAVVPQGRSPFGMIYAWREAAQTDH